MTQPRLIWADSLKGWLMLLVILGHAIQGTKGGKTKCEKTEDNGKGLFTLYIKEL